MFLKNEIEKIYQLIKSKIIRTPCVFSSYISQFTGAEVYLKLENLQRTGSFKERGALNFILTNSKQNKLTHVVTASAGNHGQAVAMHAANHNIKATIFMPVNTPNNKILQTEKLKAQVILVGQNYDEAYKEAYKFADKIKAYYIHAYNDMEVIKGQATVALEIFEQVKNIDAVVVPVGGGGLISGVLGYVQGSITDKPEIVGVEASGYKSMAKSLNKSKSIISANKTIAEGIAVKKVGDLNKDICASLNPTLTYVNDEQIQDAIMVLLEQQKIVVEGAGAAALAALMTDEFRKKFKDKRVVLIISGGNIDISLLAKISIQKLVSSRRMCRLSLIIKDDPGSLARLLGLINKSLGNVVDIIHERYFAKLKWNEVLVILTIEAKDENHERLMLDLLKIEGYHIDSHERK